MITKKNTAEASPRTLGFSAVQSLLASHALASDDPEVAPRSEDPPGEAPADTEVDSDISNDDLAVKLMEVLSTESNSETLSKVSGMIESAVVEAAVEEEAAAVAAVDDAIREGKYKPASRAALIAIAKQGREAFVAITKNVPSMHAARVAPKAVAPAADSLSDYETRAIRQAGISVESYLKLKAASAVKGR